MKKESEIEAANHLLRVRYWADQLSPLLEEYIDTLGPAPYDVCLQTINRIVDDMRRQVFLLSYTIRPIQWEPGITDWVMKHYRAIYRTVRNLASCHEKCREPCYQAHYLKERLYIPAKLMITNIKEHCKQAHKIALGEGLRVDFTDPIAIVLRTAAWDLEQMNTSTVSVARLKDLLDRVKGMGPYLRVIADFYEGLVMNPHFKSDHRYNELKLKTRQSFSTIKNLVASSSEVMAKYREDVDLRQVEKELSTTLRAIESHFRFIEQASIKNASLLSAIHRSSKGSLESSSGMESASKIKATQNKQRSSSRRGSKRSKTNHSRTKRSHAKKRSSRRKTSKGSARKKRGRKSSQTSRQ